VLSRGKVTPASVAYYTDTVAAGVEDYYAGRGEAAGEWLGRGSAAAGVQGEVSSEQLRRMFDSAHPVTGESLGAPYAVREGADRVTGWDLTFSAPKSVSTLWAVGGGAVGLEVRDAHDAAVRAALAYLEDHAAFSRTGKAGVRQVDTEGLLAAGFVHRTSRAGDPQLHTHVLVSGRVRCGDGVWRALDSRALHRQLKPAGTIYQAALRAELTARLGMAWTEVDRHGQAEVVGVPEELRRAFSSRRAEVEPRARQQIAAAEVELGRSLTPEERRREFERAVVSTRSAKQLDGSDTGLFDRWQTQADALGLPAERWAPDVLDRSRPATPLDRDQLVAEVLDELSTTQSTFERGDVVQQLARRVPATVGSAELARRWVETTADRVLAQAGVVRLAAPDLKVPAGLSRRDGMSVFVPHGAVRFTTETTLAVEQHVLDLVVAGRHAGRAIASRVAVGVAIEKFGLGDDQAAAVRRVTTAGEAVVCVVGPAGTGKSRAMGAAVHAWVDSNIGVRGLALSAVAAGVLQSEAAVASDTIAKFLFEHDRPGGPGPAWKLHPGEVVVVDEAGMVSSRDLARLLTIAEEAVGKVVLVGDPAQLGAIEAGGLFRLLAADTDAAELGEVRRFTQPWEAAASLKLRDRHPDAIGTYDDHGRVVGGDRLWVIDDAFARWRHARSKNQSVVVLAADHATVHAIALLARAARVQAGEVEPDGVLTAAGQTVGVGDEIVTLRNDRRLVTNRDGWVRNGDRWRVDARHHDGALTVSDLAERGQVTLPADYVTEHVALGYALTVHKAQGVTVDHGILIADQQLSAEALYVAMTRGRRDNTALVITDDLPLDNHDRHPPQTPAEVLAGALARPAAERAALDHLRDTLERSESLAVLAPRLANLDAWIAQHAPPNRADELAGTQAQLDHAQRVAKPGVLTRTGRENRRRVATLTERRNELAATQDVFQTWVDEHADTLDYRQQLAAQVLDRRQQLGDDAARRQPDHIVELLGPIPTDRDSARRWTHHAGRIEAFREQFGIHPGQLGNRPVDWVQAREWDLAVGDPLNTLRLQNRIAALQHERTQPRDLDLDFGIGM
jgi:conjugative relaxase-like TrwC/TraI family protein